MMLLNGRTLARRIRGKIKNTVADHHLDLGLAVILVGDDPASHTYVALKKKACEKAGIRFKLFLFETDATEQKLIDTINTLNARADITGILVQFPLPNQNPDPIVAAIDPNKDVDGFHPTNLSNLEAGKPAIASAVAIGVLKLIDETKQDVAGKNAVIVASELFARPLRALLRERQVTTSVLSPTDASLAQKTNTADILIAAAGSPRLITGEMVKPGAIVIDVGTNASDEGIVGDVDQASVESVAGFLTPVPGGVGPMTVACLLMNIVKAHQMQKKDLMKTV